MTERWARSKSPDAGNCIGSLDWLAELRNRTPRRQDCKMMTFEAASSRQAGKGRRRLLRLRFAPFRS